MRRSLFLCFIIASALLCPFVAEAKTRQVGPTSFHKQIHIPNTSRRNEGINNDESYRAPTHKKRQNRRQQRERDQNVTTEESRTQAGNATTQKRQGRRERQSNAREQRLLKRAGQSITDKANGALND